MISYHYELYNTTFTLSQHNARIRTMWVWLVVMHLIFKEEETWNVTPRKSSENKSFRAGEGRD